MNILVIAAHPDDEVLGMGGTIKKFSKKKIQVNLCVVSEGASAQYSEPKMIRERRKSCQKCGKILGISNFEFLDLPDMKLDTIPHLEINQKLEKVLGKFKPEIVFTTPSNDLNKDHQIVHDCTLVTTRLLLSRVKKLFCYELPGITKFPFSANYYEDISNEISQKIRAFKEYKSEIKKFPHARSTKSIENLSIKRGIEVGLKHAEAFQLIREISN